MEKEEVIGYAEYALRCAEFKCDTEEEAKDISQEALLELLKAIDKGKEIESVKGWICAVIERKYIDYIRKKKLRSNSIFSVNLDEIIEYDSTVDNIIKSEEYLDIRKRIAFLSEIYREVIIRYYLKNQSVVTISEALRIPQNTVKSRLDIGRKHIRKGMNMIEKKYVKQSMEPDDLWVSINGRPGENSEPFDLVGNGDRIIMNILILAYEKPITISELSEKIGIPCAYIERIVGKLIKAELMKKSQNRIYTDFIIYSNKDIYKNFELENKYSDEIHEDLIDIIKSYYDKIDFEIIKNLNKYQKDTLLSYFMVKTITSSMYSVRDEIAGHIPFEEYPDRPNNGKWYATGYHYPSGFDYENDIKSPYIISGESYAQYDSKKTDGYIGISEFDTELGHTRKYWKELTGNNDGTSTKEFIKIMYLCGIGEETELFNEYGMAVNIKSLKKIDFLIEGGFLSRDKEIKIPVLSQLEYKKISEDINECKKKVIEKYGNIYRDIYKNNYVKTGKHLSSVPENLKYMSEVNLPMMIILKAKNSGKIFKDNKENIPAVIFVKK